MAQNIIKNHSNIIKYHGYYGFSLLLLTCEEIFCDSELELEKNMLGIALDEISSNLQEFIYEKTNFIKVFWSSRSGFSEFSVLTM